MRTTLSTLRLALANSWANRASFLLQTAFMIINDGTWLVFWALFFGRVGHISGWTLSDAMVLFAILYTVGGVALGWVANSRRIGHLAADGAFDEVLVLPVSPLAFVLSRRVDAANMGDFVAGFVVFALWGHPTLERACLFLLGVVAGSAVLASFLILCGCLVFFIGGRGEVGDLGFNAIIIFASYPVDLFSGGIKILLFTAVPAAFVTGLPANLVRHFDLGTAVLLLAVAVGASLLARFVFALGLRRYSSGSLWAQSA